ncbi:LysR family transcriptional regulator [Selenomonas ruminantium]|uniref:LysR family transcriptional regulator n=1 Tax=Selenomonas ruminantium TaxID=971 RepID=UPI0026EA60D5|nr:LysR family transcriptional regulator [Selenomonas ruminantium]
MNQKQMEYFLEVYRQGNIQNAADRLFVSRQGVSKILKSLEEELGQLLFIRNPHGLVPTDYANALLPHVQRLLAEYQSIANMSTLASQSKSVVTIYALDHIMAYFGAEFLWDFHRACPDIILSTVDTTDDAALKGVLEKQCNFAIVTGEVDQNRFAAEPLFFSRYCVRLHREHLLASKEKIAYADLEGARIVSKGRAYRCFRHNIDRYILLPGIQVDLVAETADEMLITDMILRHQAINLGYDYAAVLNLHPDIVVKVLDKADELGQTVYLVWDKTTVLTQASQKFRAFLLEWLSQNGKDKVVLDCSKKQ